MLFVAIAPQGHCFGKLFFLSVWKAGLREPSIRGNNKAEIKSKYFGGPNYQQEIEGKIKTCPPVLLPTSV